MTPSYDAVAIALAARFASPTITAPAGYAAMRVSTADLPGQMTPLPTLLVFTEDSEFRTGNGMRQGVHQWLLRFYYNQAGDLARDMVALRAWANVLVDQLKGAAQLAGLVSVARVDGVHFGILRYADVEYTGLELRVQITTDEGWAAVS